MLQINITIASSIICTIFCFSHETKSIILQETSKMFNYRLSNVPRSSMFQTILLHSNPWADYENQTLTPFRDNLTMKTSISYISRKDRI